MDTAPQPFNTGDPARDRALAAAVQKRQIPLDMRLQDVRLAVERLAHSKDGCTCPTCGANAKVYARTMGRGYVLCLLWLYQASERGARAVDVQGTAPRAVLQAREFGKLALFGLVEIVQGGRWKLTPKGVEYCENRTRVPRALQVYRGEVVGQTDDFLLLSELAKANRAVGVLAAKFTAGEPVA